MRARKKVTDPNYDEKEKEEKDKEPNPGREGREERRRGKNNGAPVPGGSMPALATAQAALQSLQQASAPALWKGSFKDADVNGRLKKAGQALTSLEQYAATQFEGSPLRKDAHRVIEQLAQHMDTLPSFLDVFGKLRGKKVMEFVVDDESFFTELAKVLKAPGMDQDTLSTIITFIGQKLIEARAQPKGLRFTVSQVRCVSI